MAKDSKGHGRDAEVGNFVKQQSGFRIKEDKNSGGYHVMQGKAFISGPHDKEDARSRAKAHAKIVKEFSSDKDKYGRDW